ncbi:MAG: class I SAM-dependent methyltransferase [Candidatus Thermoplasmatota archaeon]|nr:class I SAM-dependent methyltransferase [Euryarchaeota archaeon]MBU4071353.1 class I SAM-dependent methyltransferase [Candidatus Thermoplasmatota archaeon]MBU4144629.1 class I SAM-dependent methyltransferase [Candidatus Thermoplasmatota archaeon]MBU4592389.1 class I SAM-dependent methyltransferase [Candidatus Thermoplasmatota archaeon]
MADSPAKLDVKRYPLAWNRSYVRKGTQWRGGFDLAGYAEFLDLSGNVLELGSGDGNTVDVLLPLCGNLICADIAVSSFDTLAMKNPRINRVVADARVLPFKTDTFGAIFSRHVLTHAIPGDDVLMLNEIKRVLAPGGMVLIEVFTPGDMRFGKGSEIYPRTFLREDDLVWRFYLGKELDDLVKKTGLEVRHFQLLERKVRHEGQIYQRESVVMMASKT